MDRTFLAALVTADPCPAETLRQRLAYWGVLLRCHADVDAFSNAFGGDPGHVFSDTAWNDAPYAIERPDLIVLDFERPSGPQLDLRNLVTDLAGDSGEAEILVLWNEPGPEGLRFLVEAGVGSVRSKIDWHRFDNCAVLTQEILRLARIGNARNSGSARSRSTVACPS